MKNVHESWQPLFNDDAFKIDIEELYNSGNIVYPAKEKIFKVFEMSVHEIDVLLLGQDPYHNPGQANGLSFSVSDGVKIPPSLRNIYKELQNEFPERNYKFGTGNLDRWFHEEKIFLLNASLSVIENKPASQMKLWKNFTDNVIKYISENNKKCVFLLLGNFAKSKQVLIENKDSIVVGVHPSPYSANNGFFGSNVFKNVEIKLGKQINWST